LIVLQRFSRVERVTGIEPALSAWELLERMGMCLVPCEFRGHERPGVSPGCLPKWHANGTNEISERDTPPGGTPSLLRS